jgi:hypothetical protein
MTVIQDNKSNEKVENILTKYPHIQPTDKFMQSNDVFNC